MHACLHMFTYYMYVCMMYVYMYINTYFCVKAFQSRSKMRLIGVKLYRGLYDDWYKKAKEHIAS